MLLVLSDDIKFDRLCEFPAYKDKLRGVHSASHSSRDLGLHERVPGLPKFPLAIASFLLPAPAPILQFSSRKGLTVLGQTRSSI